MVVLDACDALYWSDGLFWRALELGGDLGFTVRPGRRPQLFAGDGWQVVLAGDHLRYEGPDRSEDGPRLADPAADLHVAVDAETSTLLIRTGDGADALVVTNATVAGDVRAAGDARRFPDPTPLCDSLAARLEPP
jgi:hypothetical protein